MKDTNAKQYKLTEAKRFDLFATLFTDNAFSGFKLTKEKDEETNETVGITLICKNVDVDDAFKIAAATRLNVHVRGTVLDDIIGQGVRQFIKLNIC